MPFRLVVVMGCLTVFIATHLYATSPLPASPAGAGFRANVVMAGDKERKKGEVARSVEEDPPVAASLATTDPPAAPSSPTARRLLAGMVLAAIALLVFGGYELPRSTPLSSSTPLPSSAPAKSSLRGGTEPAPPLSVPSTTPDEIKSPAEAPQEARDDGYARILAVVGTV
jgi:hypothetical protein